MHLSCKNVTRSAVVILSHVIILSSCSKHAQEKQLQELQSLKGNKKQSLLVNSGCVRSECSYQRTGRF